MSLDWRKKELSAGEATYEYCGDCIGCGKRVFVCKSHPIRADEQLEGRLATFYADGAVRCVDCNGN